MSDQNTTPRRVRVERGIYERRDGRLEIGWRDARGKLHWRVVDGKVKAARAALAQELARRARGEAYGANPRLTFTEAAERWWSAHSSRIRPRTQDTYSSALKHLRAHFGTQRLSRIGASEVAGYVAAKRGEGFKGWSIKGHLTVLSLVFKYSSRHLGFREPNPVALLERSERPSTDDAKPKRVLSSEELERLLAAVPSAYRLIFRTAAETGMRLSEVLGLTWEGVSYADQTITVAAQLARHGRRVPLKTRRSRRVLEITLRLMGELREHSLRTGSKDAHALVFATSRRTGHDHRNIGGRVLAKAVERAGLGTVEVGGEVVQHAPTFHDLRHSHGSALIAQGWDIEEVSARLGHADIATTMRAYVHAFDAARRSDERRSRLDRLYGNSMETTSRSKRKQMRAPNHGDPRIAGDKRGDVAG
jgi:integrase